MEQANQVNTGSGGEVGGSPNGGVVTSPAATGATGTATTTKSHGNGGRFDFDDGGTYCGGWEEGKAHGHGVCTGPKGQGAYSGSWHYGFEVSGVYTWPSGSAFEGQWQNGKRHGLGVETRGRWIYRGEWTQGFKGRYGVRQSNTSTAKYEGTWANGLQDGYGSETYADDGTYQGQWLRGMRHGYGVRNSAQFGKASKYRSSKIRASLTSLRSNEGASSAAPDPAEKRDRRVDDSRGGFVLKVSSAEPTVRRRSLVEKSSNIKKSLLSKIRKQRSTGDLEKRGAGTGSIRSTGSSTSWVSTDSTHSVMTNASVHTDSNASFVVEDEQMDVSVTETYMGEWKNDKRTGFGISERSDGLRYEGEWFANKKYGYGVTTFNNGEKEEGKYKNNVLITSQKKKHLFLIRSAKFRERIDAAVNAAQRASKIALQKADIAISRTATARGKAEAADISSLHAREDCDKAQATAKQFAPDFKQPGLERLRARDKYRIADYGQKDTLSNQTQSNQIPNSTASMMYQQPTSNATSQIPYSVQSQTLNQIPNQMPESKKLLHNSLPDPESYHQQQHQQVQHQQQQQLPSKPAQTNNLPSNLANTMYGSGTKLAGSSNQLSNQTIGTDSIRNNRNSLPPEDAQQISANLRRNSRQLTKEKPSAFGSNQSSIDHFDHYKRPPSRDSSVDRYTRATGRLGGPGSRQPSVDKTLNPPETPERTARAPSAIRGVTPAPATPTAGNGSVLTGSGKPPFAGQPPFEDIILRQRNLGQDIVPSPGQPKRTESLYISPGRPAAPPKNIVPPQVLQRKKSLPDVQAIPKATEAMSREEVSALGSARREEIRRQADENERLRANPLLYLVSPQVKDWFSRQQLVIVVLFINVSLAIMFFKLLT